MKTYITKTQIQRIEILPSDTCILDLDTLGLTETKNFNRNYTHSSKRFIEVTNVRQNPNANRIFFVSVKNPQDLALLVQNFHHEIDIINDDIAHNEFAVLKYQVAKR